MVNELAKDTNTIRRIRLGGIKFSEELVHVTIGDVPNKSPLISTLLQKIAQAQINLPFLSRHTCSSTTICFCLEAIHKNKVQTILASLFNPDQFSLTLSVGTLTLFPHNYSFYLVGRIMEFFSSNSYPIYSFSTSISTLAINTDFSKLDDIAHLLQNEFTLPENHAPFRQNFRVEQIKEKQ